MQIDGQGARWQVRGQRECERRAWMELYLQVLLLLSPFFVCFLLAFFSCLPFLPANIIYWLCLRVLDPSHVCPPVCANWNLFKYVSQPWASVFRVLAPAFFHLYLRRLGPAFLWPAIRRCCCQRHLRSRLARRRSSVYARQRFYCSLLNTCNTIFGLGDWVGAAQLVADTVRGWIPSQIKEICALDRGQVSKQIHQIQLKANVGLERCTDDGDGRTRICTRRKSLTLCIKLKLIYVG